MGVEGVIASFPAKTWFQSGEVKKDHMGKIMLKWLPVDPYALEVHVLGEYDTTAFIDISLFHAAIADNDGQFHRGTAGSPVAVLARQDLFGVCIDIPGGSIFALARPEKAFEVDLHIMATLAEHGPEMEQDVAADLETFLLELRDVEE